MSISLSLSLSLSLSTILTMEKTQTFEVDLDQNCEVFFANQLPDFGYSSKHPHLVVWKVANRNLSESSTLLVHTRVGQFLEVLKNCRFWLCGKKIQNQRTASSSYFKTLKGRMVLSLVFWLLWKFSEWPFYAKTIDFENLENQTASEYIYIPGLITSGYLSLILRTAQHWYILHAHQSGHVNLHWSDDI